MSPARLAAAATILLLLPLRMPTPQWMEVKRSRYSIFHQPGYEHDAEFARKWLDRAEALMKMKYGVAPDGYHIALYLHPAPTDNADVNRALNRCCTLNPRGINTGTIDYLAPSASAWKDKPLLSSLGLPKDDPNYHAKVIVSEYIPIGHYAVQASRAAGGWRYYSAPEWFTQGLQEYDAIFHTTEWNRTMAAGRLLAWARKRSASFACCSSGISVGDAYNGGATLMAFLAAEFGEDIHVRLLRHSAPTFESALADLTHPHTLPALFERFRTWVDRTAAAVPPLLLPSLDSRKEGR